MLLPETDPTGASCWLRRSGWGSTRTSPAVGSPEPSLSIGVVSYPDDGRNADELIISADGAMYASKRAGKDRVTGVPIQSGRPATPV